MTDIQTFKDSLENPLIPDYRIVVGISIEKYDAVWKIEEGEG